MSVNDSEINSPLDRKYSAIIAAVIGNALEWYDYAIYGFLSPIIAQLFFPKQTAITSLLLTFSVFGVGFVMRPLGAIIFGHYGDRYGRKRALSAVIFLMAISTFGIGVLPTYTSAGILAPILLVIARLAQGLSSGGEWGGSATYLIETTPIGHRGFIGSWQQVSVGTGFLLGSFTAALLTNSLTLNSINTWGWRIPFIFGIVVGVIGIFLRLRLADTHKFAEIANQNEISRLPLKEAFTKYRYSTLKALGITVQNTVAYYLILIYMSSWLTTVVKMPHDTALWIGTICLVIFVVLVPFMGILSDRIGRKPLLVTSCLGYIFLTYPAFLIASTGSVAGTFAAQLLLVVFLAMYGGPGPALYCELFPTRVRYTALSIGYNVGVAIFGGFAPFIATLLIQLTGDIVAPSYYAILAALTTLITLIWVRETAFEVLSD